MSQLFIDFDPVPVVITAQFEQSSTVKVLQSVSSKPALPAPRRVNRTRVGMLVAAATFGRLSTEEQAELDAALGAEGAK